MSFAVFYRQFVSRSRQSAEAGYVFVLVSGGIELFFFLLADTMLCFGFNMRRMLITQKSLAVAKQWSGTFQCLMLCHMHRKLEVAQLGKLTLTDQKNILYHMVSWAL